MRKQLRHNLNLLGEGDRDMPERHRTLRATIEWSYQLLDAAERRAFTALGVFPGSFTADSGEEVAAVDIGQLAALVDKSLIRPSGNGRFYMLATIREEARALLDASEVGLRIHAAHAAHYLSFVEQAHDALDARDAEVLDRVELERDNIRATLTWFTATREKNQELSLAGAMGPFWYVQGQLAEGRERIEHALAEGRDPTLRARALRSLVRITVTQGDLVAAAAAAEESIELHKALGDHGGLAKAYQDRANIAVSRGDFVSARADFASADVLLRRVGNTAGLAVTTSMLAYLALLEEDENAVDLAEQAVHAVRAAGEPETMPLLTLAFAYVRTRNPESAVSAAQEAGQIALAHAHKPALSYCVQAIGAAAAVRGDSEMAARLLAAADAARSMLSVSLDPFEERVDQQAREAVRESLSPERFSAIWAEGAALTLDQAVAVALGEASGRSAGD
jgi:tetratricopeptide (TPR) repeat protein